MAGAALRRAGHPYFNPDEVSRRYRERLPRLSLEEANSRAWHQGRELLETAIERRARFAFETTLGGRTITGLLLKASNIGLRVRMWYVGLTSPELHIRRVRARAAKGGHDIPEETIRRRWNTGRENLVRLLPHLTELKMWDNSREADPAEGETPEPILLLHFAEGDLPHVHPLEDMPRWARPIVVEALRLHGVVP